jgi:hypothetical protein
MEPLPLPSIEPPPLPSIEPLPSIKPIETLPTPSIEPIEPKLQSPINPDAAMDPSLETRCPTLEGRPGTDQDKAASHLLPQS